MIFRVDAVFPERITFITNPHACNLRCPVCFRYQAPLDWVAAGEMDFAVVRRVVEAFAPLGLREVVPSTSGEPLLYSRFADLLDLVAAQGLRLNLTTNGTFPGGGVSFWAPRLLPVLSDIKISVMGYTAAVNGLLMAGIDAVRQRANILELLEARAAYGREHALAKGELPTISLQVTEQEANRDEIPALREWALAVGIDRVKVNPVWWLGAYDQPTDGVNAPTGTCPFLGREAWVWVDGSFQICPNPDARYGCRTAQPLGDFGNFTTGDPVALWQGALYRRFCEDFPRHPLCLNCRMRNR